MAEINVEKKSKKPIWPWIVAIILIVGIIWLLAGTGTDEEEYETAETQDIETVDEMEQETMQQSESPLAEYINFIKAREGEVGLSHEYTQNGLQHLADALAYLHNQNQTSNGNQYLSEINTVASSIVEHTYSEQHADKIRNAFMAAANFMQNLPDSEYPELQDETDGLMQSAESIKSDELATDQANEIKNFFGEVANAFSEIENV